MRAWLIMSPLITLSSTTQGAQTPGQRVAMALRHLALGRCREAHAQVAEGLELRITERMAVHDVDVWPEQPFGL
jgi:hypothetical protein